MLLPFTSIICPVSNKDDGSIIKFVLVGTNKNNALPQGLAAFSFLSGLP